MSYGGQATDTPAAQAFCFEITQQGRETRYIRGADAYQIRSAVTLEQLIQGGHEVELLATRPVR